MLRLHLIMATELGFRSILLGFWSIGGRPWPPFGSSRCARKRARSQIVEITRGCLVTASRISHLHILSLHPPVYYTHLHTTQGRIDNPSLIISVDSTVVVLLAAVATDKKSEKPFANNINLF